MKEDVYMYMYVLTGILPPLLIEEDVYMYMYVLTGILPPLLNV